MAGTRLLLQGRYNEPRYNEAGHTWQGARAAGGAQRRAQRECTRGISQGACNAYGEASCNSPCMRTLPAELDLTVDLGLTCGTASLRAFHN